MSFTHGQGGYTNHACRCPVCKRGNADYQLAYKARRSLETENAPHGTYSAYTNWKCRCRPCKDANAARGRAYNARRRTDLGGAA